MANASEGYGHLGLMFGILSVLILLSAFYVAAYPYGIGAAVLFFPILVWAIGLLFVVGEIIESRGP